MLKDLVDELQTELTSQRVASQAKGRNRGDGG